MSDKTGGPAFPSHGAMGEVVCEGMTLRDYAAIEAMAAIITSMPDKYHSPEDVAADSYKMADAMLSERNKGE